MLRNLDIFDEHNPALDHLVADLFASDVVTVKRLFNKAISAEIFRAKSSCEFNDMQDLIFLYIYIFLLNLDRMDEIDINGSAPLDSVIFESYDMDTVRKYFADVHIEVKPLLADFS